MYAHDSCWPRKNWLLDASGIDTDSGQFVVAAGRTMRGILPLLEARNEEGVCYELGQQAIRQGIMNKSAAFHEVPDIGVTAIVRVGIGLIWRETKLGS
jgi:hypothetical protein